MASHHGLQACAEARCGAGSPQHTGCSGVPFRYHRATVARVLCPQRSWLKTWAPFGLALALASTLSCGALLGIDSVEFPDGGGASPGINAEGGSRDGDAVLGDGAPADAAGLLDGVAPPDGATDSFCATLSPAPTFCEDFDDGLFPQRWPKKTKTGDATIELTQSEAHSAPYSLHETVAPTGVSTRTAYVERSFSGSFTSLKLSYRVYRRSTSGPPSLVARVGVAPGYDIELELDGQALAVTAFGFKNGVDTLGVQPQWAQLTLEVDVAQSQVKVGVTDFDGDHGGLHPATTGGFPDGIIDPVLTIGALNTPGPNEGYVDDVVLYLTP